MGICDASAECMSGGQSQNLTVRVLGDRGREQCMQERYWKQSAREAGVYGRWEKCGAVWYEEQEAGKEGKGVKEMGSMEIERHKGCDMKKRGEDAQWELEKIVASGNEGEGMP